VSWAWRPHAFGACGLSSDWTFLPQRRSGPHECGAHGCRGPDTILRGRLLSTGVRQGASDGASDGGSGRLPGRESTRQLHWRRVRLPSSPPGRRTSLSPNRGHRSPAGLVGVRADSSGAPGDAAGRVRLRGLRPSDAVGAPGLPASADQTAAGDLRTCREVGGRPYEFAADRSGRRILRASQALERARKGGDLFARWQVHRFRRKG